MSGDGRPTILFVAPSAYPLGGVATWLDYLMPGLTQNGWAVQLCLTSGRFHDVDAYLRAHPFNHVLVARNPTGSREGRFQALAKVIGTADPDIVVTVNLIDAYPAVDRLRSRQNCKTRVVKALHGIQPDFYQDIATYRQVLDAVVCTNRLACRLAETEGKIESERSHYAPCGVPRPAGFESGPPAGARPLNIAFVGRFEQFQKRVFDLPPIIRELDRRQVDFRLVLAGAGPDEAKLKEQLAPWIATGKVEFLGALSAEDLSRCVYQVVDAVLITSFWETGPLVAWEAMAHGVPVVSAEFIGSGLEAALQHGRNCLLFPIGRAQDAADCLAKLMNADVREKIASAARDLVSSRYSLDQSVKQWEGCFRQILQRKARVYSGPSSEYMAESRLDKVLGSRLGERMRRALNREFRHCDPGGEWPHTGAAIAADDARFWALAKNLDQG